MGTNYASLASSVNADAIRIVGSGVRSVTLFNSCQNNGTPRNPRRLPSAYPDRGRSSFLSENKIFPITHLKSIADCQVLAYTLKTRRCIDEQRQTP